jgi:hypothetical protein
MVMSYLIAFAFLAILGSLAAALYFMMKDGTHGKAKTSHMARALAFRVGFRCFFLSAFCWPGNSVTYSPQACPTGDKKGRNSGLFQQQPSLPGPGACNQSQ